MNDGSRLKREKRKNMEDGMSFLEDIEKELDVGHREQDSKASSVQTDSAIRKELIQSKDKYRTLVENIDDVLFSADPNGVITYVSPRVSRYGFTPDNVTGRSFLEIVEAEDHSLATEAFVNTLNAGKELPTELRIRDAEGYVRWFEVKGNVSRGRHGQVTEFNGVLRDITRRKLAEKSLNEQHNAVQMHANELEVKNDELRKAQEQLITANSELRESKERLKQVGDLSPFPIWILDSNGRTEYINPQFTRVFGYKMDEVLTTQAWLNLVYKDDESRKAAIARWKEDKAKFNGHEPVKRLFEFVRKDGDTRIVSTRAMRMDDGKTYMVFHDITDGKRAEKEARRLNAEIMETNAVLEEEISERKETERQLQLAKEQYRTIFANSAVGITVTDKDENIISWNKYAEFMLGMNEDDLYMKPVKSLYSQKEWRRIRSSNVRQKGMQHQLETKIIRKNPKGMLDIALSLSVLRDADGEITGSIGVFVDITERKQIEAALWQAKREAEEINLQLETAIQHANEMAVQAELANKAKSEFLASMSHEIRTPMNAILGMADLLGETNLSPEQQQYVNTFQSAGENLLSIISDILDISKVESGHLELEEIGFDLVELIEKTCEVMAVRAHEKMIELGHFIAPDVPTKIKGDPTRLRQIFTNLIGNAIKFTEEGGIFVEIKRTDAADTGQNAEEVELLCSVKDTGMGIPSEKVDTIFEVFTQVDASTTRKHGGTGLGLTISRQLSELMGGRIWAESEFGKGSAFHFTAEFKLQTESEIEQRKTIPLDVQGLKILVVDDTDTNRLILRAMLSELGASITEAEGGSTGLAELKRAKEMADPYQLVLLDCRMPDMDGFTMMEKVRSEVGLDGTTIMMLTSDSRSGDIYRSKELGIASYLVKPVKRRDLLESIASVLGQSTRAEQPKPRVITVESEELLPIEILLVEDNDDNRLLIQSFLKKTPYEIDTAENGEIAVERFKSSRYDLVLMDVQMPVMDGYTATRIIREWEQEKGSTKTPIVALTAHATVEDEKKSLEAGCTGHLTKPIKKARLLEAIREFSQQ